MYPFIHSFLSLFFFISHNIVASSPDNKTKTDNIPGATSSSSSSIVNEQKSLFIDKGLDTEAQRSQVTLSTASASSSTRAAQHQQHQQQQQLQSSAPTLNGLISSELVFRTVCENFLNCVCEFANFFSHFICLCACVEINTMYFFIPLFFLCRSPFFGIR